MHQRSRLFAVLVAALVGLSPVLANAQACTANNGTFRFLNTAFPSLSTNGPVFVGQLVVANADGPVTFSLDLSGGNSDLPPGLSLDPQSGLITGLATHSGTYKVVFVANDTTQQISQPVTLNVSSSGGGGNGGSGLTSQTFPNGRVGAAYSYTVVPSGDGPYVFGGSDLPPGLSLNGATGEVSGSPTAAGTFFMSLTVNDLPPGEVNIGASIIPVTILPASSDFAFVTRSLNNGELGTSFCDQYATQNGSGTVTFGASGLPSGLMLDSATGAVTGTPTVPGTFLVTITANDGSTTITTNLSMVIAPGSASDFHWDYLGMPAALANATYDRQPPIVLTAEGASGAITYAAVGLPVGISYNSSSGQLSGVATQQGEFPVTFTATDGVETINLDTTFIVLPPTGGDVSQIVVNFWVRRESLGLGTAGRESWRVSAIYNADRRTGSRFDPTMQTFKAVLGSRVLQLDPNQCTGPIPDHFCSFASASGVTPVVRVRLVPRTQTMSWSTGDDTIAETVPGILPQTVVLGDFAWRLQMNFDANGVFRPPLDLERTAFVVASGSLALNGMGLDSARLRMMLADQNFAYSPGVSTLRIQILEGATVLVDRDFTALGGPATTGVDSRTGKPWVSFRTLSDASTTDRVAMRYSSHSGQLSLTLSELNLSAISNTEAYLTVQLTVGARVYTTAVTFFAPSAGRYTLVMP